MNRSECHQCHLLCEAYNKPVCVLLLIDRLLMSVAVTGGLKKVLNHLIKSPVCGIYGRICNIIFKIMF